MPVDGRQSDDDLFAHVDNSGNLNAYLDVWLKDRVKSAVCGNLFVTLNVEARHNQFVGKLPASNVT